MTDELNVFHASVTGALAVAAGFFGFIGRRFINKVDATAEDLAKHKLEDVGKYATVEAISLIHQRIDASGVHAEENFRELRNGIGEIKTLLIQGVR